MPEADSWDEWRRHVLLELERLNKSVESNRTKLEQIRSDIVALKVKAGTFGALAGLIATVLVAVLAEFIKKNLQ